MGESFVICNNSCWAKVLIIRHYERLSTDADIYYSTEQFPKPLKRFKMLRAAKEPCRTLIWPLDASRTKAFVASIKSSNQA